MRFIPALLSAATLLFVASCTSPIVLRIERNPEIYNALSERHKALVQQGRVEEGMTKGAVFLSWGRPDHVSHGSRNKKAYEKWSYSGYAAAYRTELGYGPHFGGFYGGAGYRGYDPFWYDGFYNDPFFYDHVTTYVPYEARRVEFSNGIVFAWSATR
jgi:hypothetical protein